MLLESFIDIDIKDADGHTPLYLASFKGHVDCVECLLEHNAQVLVHDNITKRTPLHAAAYNGHTDCLRYLLQYSQTDSAIDCKDAEERTPLMAAVGNGFFDCANLLLSEGANVLRLDIYHRSALHRASANGHDECAESLLCKEADPLCRDCNGRTPLHFAAACGHVGILSTLLQAVGSGVHMDNHGYTPLHWACFNGHDTCVDILLEGDHSNAFDGNPFTPLHCAVINDYESCAEMLLDTLGDEIVNLRDKKDRSPMHAAAFNDQVECIQLLLSRGGNVDAVDQSGTTPLIMAAENGHAGAVEFLVGDGGADISASDNNKNTALHVACSQGHAACALLVVEKMRDPFLSFANNSLQTPLHLAAKNGMVPVVQELIARGANLLAEDEDGHNPALACAPNAQVADCLALILVAMVPSLRSPLATSVRLDNPDGHTDDYEEDNIDFSIPTHNATM